MLNDLKCLLINFYLLTMFDALCDVMPQEEVTFFITFTNVFLIFVTFLRFLTFIKFLFQRFYIYGQKDPKTASEWVRLPQSCILMQLFRWCIHTASDSAHQMCNGVLSFDNNTSTYNFSRTHRQTVFASGRSPTHHPSASGFSCLSLCSAAYITLPGTRFDLEHRRGACLLGQGGTINCAISHFNQLYSSKN